MKILKKSVLEDIWRDCEEDAKAIRDHLHMSGIDKYRINGILLKKRVLEAAEDSFDDVVVGDHILYGLPYILSAARVTRVREYSVEIHGGLDIRRARIACKVVEG